MLDSDKAVHELAPHGDLILVLQDPDAPFAPSNDELKKASDSLNSTPVKSSKSKKSNEDVKEAASQPANISFKCSSSHLILASTYFRSMLEGPWSESSGSTKSLSTVNAENWDSAAMLIVLNVIHGHNRKVPQKIDLELLAKIAVITDYYGCHECLDLWIDRWDVSMGVVEFNRDSVLRLTILSVFPQLSPKALSRMLDLAVRDGKGLLDTLGLPIRPDLIEWIDQTRQSAISALLKNFQSLVDENR